MKISDYNLLEKLDESEYYVVYRGIRQGDTQTVIIVTLNTALASLADIAAFHREYEVITQINCKGIVNAFKTFDTPDGMVLVLEDFNGLTLRQVLNSEGTYGVASFLDAAVILSQTLGEIHSHGIIHRQIRPQNILVNTQKGEIKLTRFGVDAQLTHEYDSLFKLDISRKYLMYVAPEQTGQLNRGMDSRADLYSLGVVFYEMLTGGPPFRSEDPFHLINSHISQKPVPPRVICPDIPEALSDIILELLNKEADDRYQDGFSLNADLEHCKKEFALHGRIERFKLGRIRLPSRAFVPQKVYGRSREYHELISAFNRMDPLIQAGGDRSRRAEIILVKGAAGTGKTSLVNEIRPLAMERGSCYTYGKFHPYHKDIPYSAIIQAFQYLIHQILTEHADRIELWKQDFQEALGPNGKIMTELFPDLEKIIGPQKNVVDLGLKEARSRFTLTFERFVSVFARKEHPVFLLIDNMHWADMASLQLFMYLLSRRNIQHLFFIGLYRETDVSPDHPFILAIKKAEEIGVRITTINLGNLGADTVLSLVRDLLPWDEGQCRAFSHLVHGKTGGNPFFIKELLHTWIDSGLLDTGSPSARSTEAVEKAYIPQDLQTMLRDKILQLPEPVQGILEICACMGSRFEVEGLAMYTGRSLEAMDGILWDLGRRRVIKMIDGYYHFFHDLVFEAVCVRMDDRKRAEIHYGLGKFLLSQDDCQVDGPECYHAADHLNLGLSCITDPLERERLCTLNLTCARKAKNDTAYAAASAYLERAMDLLNEDSWESQYVLTLSIHNECIEIASFMGETEQMNQFLKTSLEKARTIQDKALAYRSKIAACSAQEDINEALSAAFFFNDLLELKITGSDRELILRYIKLKVAFWSKSDEDILALPDMTDPLALAAMDVGSNLGYFLYTMSPEIVSSGVLYNVVLSLTLGLSPQTAFNYCVLGLVLISRFGKIDEGYRFGKLGMKLSDKPLSQRFRSRAIYVYYSQICHWKEPLVSTLEPLKEGYRTGVENGDPLYAADNLGMHDAHLLKCGYGFIEAEPIIRDHCIKIKQLNQEQIFYRSSITHQFALNMMGKCDDPCKLKGEALDEDREIPKWIEQDKRVLLALYWYHVLTLCVVFDKIELGLKASEEATKHLDATGSSLTVREFRFMDSLIRLSAHVDLPGDEQKKNLKRINENLALIKTWTRHAPMNTLHMYRLIRAEKARVLGKHKRAETLYDKALSSCRELGFPHHEMLITECAARHYSLRGKTNLSLAYRLDTIQCCRKLGAMAKLNRIRESMPEMLALQAPMPGPEPIVASDRRRLEPSHVSAVVDTCRMISAETTQARVLKRVLDGALMHAEATRCFIVLNGQGELRVAYEGGRDISDGGFDPVSVDVHGDLPATIIKQAARTQKVLILDNATQQGDFTLDPYVVEHQPLSVLCYPVMRHDGLMGVIYLENDGVTDAFTPNKVEVVGMIASQMSVSISHALSFENLNDKIRMISGRQEPSFGDPEPAPDV